MSSPPRQDCATPPAPAGRRAAGPPDGRVDEEDGGPTEGLRQHAANHWPGGQSDPASTCSELADGLDVPLSTLSNHWRILRESGLISITVDGRHRRIRPRADDMSVRFPGVLDPILHLDTSGPARAES